MNNVIGLSHLVFSVNRDFETGAAASPLLKQYFSEGDYFEFDHSADRLDLIRENKNALSRLSFYKSIEGNLPAVELLHVNNTVKRSPEKYGLVINNNGFTDHAPVQRLEFAGGKYYADYYYDPFLNSYIAIATNLFEKEAGCWAAVRDFETQRNFLSGIPSGKVMVDTDDLFVFKCRVVNKKFSSFCIALVKDNTDGESIFNDDQGLSTLGWFVRDLAQEELISVFEKRSETFSINMNNNILEARFLFNNKGLSHELLKIN